MYAVGHFALGYLAGKFSAKSLNVAVNLPLVFLASVLPDIDILIPFLEHRGPLHSVLVHCLLFIPLLLIFKKRSLPYFSALIVHSLIGDFLFGGTQLLWPVSLRFYGFNLGMNSLHNYALELLVFVVSVVVMFKSKDLWSLLKRDSINLILFIPLMTVLLPALVTFPMYVPIVLFVPHVFYVGLFVLSIYFSFK